MVKKLIAAAFILTFLTASSHSSAAFADHGKMGMGCPHGKHMMGGWHEMGLKEKFFMKAHLLLESQSDLGLTDDQVKEIRQLKLEIKKSWIRQNAEIEILKQDILEPMPLARQVVVAFAGNEGFLDDLPLAKVKAFEKDLLQFIDKKHAALEHEIAAKKAIDDNLKVKLKDAVRQFKEEFKQKN